MSVNFKDSGQLGDIIYALPAMQLLARRFGQKRFTLCPKR